MSLNDYIYWETVYKTGKTPDEIYKEEHPKVIRCKNCKWHTSNDKCTNPHWDSEELIMYHSAFENDYCSYGEEKDETN